MECGTGMCINSNHNQNNIDSIKLYSSFILIIIIIIIMESIIIITININIPIIIYKVKCS